MKKNRRLMDQLPNKPRKHIQYARCWCKPEHYYTSPVGGEVWIHNDESGAVPTPKQIAEAIAISWGVLGEAHKGGLRWKIGVRLGLVALRLSKFFRKLAERLSVN